MSDELEAAVSEGRVLQVNVSQGGVPKLPVPAARVTRWGVEGDRQGSPTVHGGPHRAVSLLGIEAIRRVAAEGHPIGPGTTGENLTVEGFDVSALPVGSRLAIGDELVLELAWPANPCRTIRHSFRDLRYGRLAPVAHPRDARMYARVVAEGVARPGDPVRVLPPEGDAAERQRIAARLDDAERSSVLSVWRAALAGGADLRVRAEGDLAVAAGPDLPGPIFNSGYGFALLPHLASMAVDHFRDHGVAGWVWADEPPWEDAEAEAEAVLAAAPPNAIDDAAPVEDVRVRELARDEVGAWAEVIAEAAELPAAVADAWRALEPGLARSTHDHRFVAEVNGEVVGTGLLHVRHRIGWLRAATVAPAWRGRGIQRRLIAARAATARRLGCELVGSLANVGSPSARNLESAGLRAVATRARYAVRARA